MNPEGDEPPQELHSNIKNNDNNFSLYRFAEDSHWRAGLRGFVEGPRRVQKLEDIM